MTKQFIYCLIFLGLGIFISSQERRIDTIFISDKRLKETENFQNIISITNDDKRKNTNNLSELLRFQTPFYIKENGKGMVSSPSFRGTTAQQTAFVWNGININSIFLGQGDINNIGLLNFDKISVKAGGGSISYGTGAIGGSVHLDDEIVFNKKFQGNFFSEYGSFNTLNSSLKLSYSDDKLSVKLNTAIAKSDNNYEVPSEKYKNLNGNYYQYNYSLSGAYRFSNNQKIAFFSIWNTGLQHYPIFSETQTRTKYATNGLKTMLNWEGKFNKIHNDLKIAFLRDTYDYYADIYQPKSNGAIGDTWLIRNDLSYQETKNFKINLINEYQHNSAKGYSSGIINPKRNLGYSALIIRKNLSEKIDLEGAIRKDFVENIQSPYLFSLSSKMDFSKHYLLKINASKNFRYPTFNDLYWQPGGNPLLKPEIAYQLEMSHHLRGKKWEFNITPFFNHIENMIQWLPTSEGHWSPFNTRKVRSYGFEVYSNITQKIGSFIFKANGSYAYTHSENLETKKLLSYVPQHKTNGTISLQHKKKIEIFGQVLFTGEVFTTTDEDKRYALPYYTIFNTGINFNINQHIKLGGKINNVFNEVYKTSDYYPLPLRNYNINLNINF